MSSQFRSHFLRQLKGRLQTGQIFEGKLSFLCMPFSLFGAA